jgi:hypothetical protein
VLGWIRIGAGGNASAFVFIYLAKGCWLESFFLGGGQNGDVNEWAASNEWPDACLLHGSCPGNEAMYDTVMLSYEILFS